MKKLFTLFFLLLMLWPSAAKAKGIYGFMTGNSPDDGQVPIGLFSFDSDVLVPYEEVILPYAFWGGAWADGTYYMILSDDYMGNMPEGLCTYDFQNQAIELPFARHNYQCADMTYDYSTGTMYGIQIQNGGSAVPTSLITIDLADGHSTVVAELSVKVQAIACNYYGDLFAMGPDGTLYRLNSKTGELAAVGKTGIKTNNSERQSLEFDRGTGQLFWTGLDSKDDTFFIELDAATGKVVNHGYPDDNSLIVGLHIPFVIAAADAPAAPTEVKAKMAAGQVMLQWRNPDHAADGSPLAKELTHVEVWRNNELVYTDRNPVAGQTSSWVDETAKGLTKYIVHAHNAAGRSEGAVCELVAGEDVPSEVTDVTVTMADGVPVIRWTAPSTGRNGGAIDPTNLTYTVTRQPAGVVFDNIRATEFADKGIADASYCSWSIVANNITGSSYAVTSEAVAAGPALQAPYASSMSTDAERAQWKIVDGNADGNTWRVRDGGGYVYSTSWTMVANDSLVSVPFALEKGKNYIARYTIFAQDMFSTEDFALVLRGNGGEKELERLASFTNAAPEVRAVEFAVDADGIYTFALTALSQPGQWQIEVSSFSLSRSVETDLAVRGAEQSIVAVQGRSSEALVSIANTGTKAVESYEVSIADQSGNEIGHRTFDTALAAGSETTVAVEYVAPQAGDWEYTVTVHAAGDGEPMNDSAVMAASVVGPDMSIVEAGGRDVFTSFPYRFEGQPFCYTQAVYRKEELGGYDTGDIVSLTLRYLNLEGEVDNVDVRLYLANTSNNSVRDGWIYSDEMTKVFDGPVSFAKGEHNLQLTFDTPFKYTGENLCVLYEKENDMTEAGIGYAAAETFDARTAVLSSETQGIDITRVQGAARLNYIMLMVRDAAAVEGVAAAGSDAPAEYFNLQGMPVHNPGPGLYIRRQGGRTSKVVVR